MCPYCQSSANDESFSFSMRYVEVKCVDCGSRYVMLRDGKNFRLNGNHKVVELFEYVGVLIGVIAALIPSFVEQYDKGSLIWLFILGAVIICISKFIGSFYLNAIFAATHFFHPQRDKSSFQYVRGVCLIAPIVFILLGLL